MKHTLKFIAMSTNPRGHTVAPCLMQRRKEETDMVMANRGANLWTVSYRMHENGQMWNTYFSGILCNTSNCFVCTVLRSGNPSSCLVIKIRRIRHIQHYYHFLLCQTHFIYILDSLSGISVCIFYKLSFIFKVFLSRHIHRLFKLW